MHIYPNCPSSQPRPFKGSAIVLNDQSKDSIISRLASDVYVKERIWDLDRAIIVPFRTLIRRTLA